MRRVMRRVVRFMAAAAVTFVSLAAAPAATHGASVLNAQTAPASAVSAASSAMTPADSAALAVFRRAQRLVNDGQGAEGRALVDSVLNAAEPRSREEAEALFWRATLAESWDAAQKDYLRLMLEHERSPRAGDAMLRLAQGEAARGDRDAALRYLERLSREAPDSPARAEAGLWQGRLLLERGSRTPGCAVLRTSRPLLKPGSVELENQYDYLMRACPDSATLATEEAAAAAAAAAAAQPAPRQTASGNTPRATPPAAAPPPAPARGGGWSVQVAAMSTMAEANAIVEQLKAKGYDARVDTRTAPFRVRFGRFPTSAAATAASEAYKQKERADAFIVQVPPG